MKCNWCQSTENQEKVGEDWLGHIICCRKCGHEYVVRAKTKQGDDFWDFLDQTMKKLSKKLSKK